MIVSMWMSKEVVTVTPHARITEAASLMAAKGVRRLPVLDAHAGERHLAGIVSATDIYRAYPSHINPFALLPKSLEIATTVGEIMNRHPITIAPEAPIEDVAKAMRDRKIGALLVVRGDELVGLITESDIFRAFAACFQSAPGGARVTFDISQGEDVLELIFREARLRGIRVINLFLTRQLERPTCVVQFSGDNVDAFVNDLWQSGHQVLNVLRVPRENRHD